jgi:hypothetical protein
MELSRISAKKINSQESQSHQLRSQINSLSHKNLKDDDEDSQNLETNQFMKKRTNGSEDLKSMNSKEILEQQMAIKQNNGSEQSSSKNDMESEESSQKSNMSKQLKQKKILDLLHKQLQSDVKHVIDGTKYDTEEFKTFAEELDEEQLILPNVHDKYENTKAVESDVDEDTYFGQGILLKDGTISHDATTNPDNWRPNLIIANIIHIFLVISGIYCCFLGFRFFKMTMILLGLDCSYYFVILFLTEFDIYDAENIGHQLGVFFGSLLLGFGVSILSYIYEKSQFVIIGFSISSMISVFIAQFFINFEDNSDKIMILSIYLGCALIFTIAAYAAQHSTLIWGTVIVGSILATINFGVLLNDFKSFEQREKLPNDRYADFVNYLIANAILICLGLLVQFYLKKKIIQRLRKEDEELDSDMYTVRATTFL